MRAADRWILRACDRLDALPLAAALALLAAVMVAVSLALLALVVVPLVAAYPELRLPRLDALLRKGPAWTLLVAVVVFPLLETWLLQSLPFWVTRHWSGRPSVLVAASALAFALPHALGSLVHGITTLAGGVLLGLTYFWASRRPPRPHPVLSTWAVHAMNNLAALGLVAAITR